MILVMSFLPPEEAVYHTLCLFKYPFLKKFYNAEYFFIFYPLRFIGQKPLNNTIRLLRSLVCSIFYNRTLRNLQFIYHFVIAEAPALASLQATRSAKCATMFKSAD